MIRRKFISMMITAAGTGLIAMLSSKSSFASDIFSKIRNRLNPSSDQASDGEERREATLPEEGPSISVETALNSRCTGDYDDDPRKIHWGMFDKAKILAPAQIKQVISYARIPRFTNARIQVKIENDILTFTIENHFKNLLRDWVMVESGMQQQAIGLVCAALGIGYVFRTLGVDGKLLSTDEFATVRIKLDAMKPSYNGAYWTIDAPVGIKYVKTEILLSEPVRRSKNPLLTVINELKTANDAGKPLSKNNLGQLLWAAKGRTPHFSISAPWGMTIPTYNVKEIITSVHVIFDGVLYKYLNGTLRQSMHALESVRNVDITANGQLNDLYKPYNCLIILNTNESKARSFWEVGYQLLNLMLQAHSLGIAYRAVLLDESPKQLFRNAGIKDPVAILLIRR